MTDQTSDNYFSRIISNPIHDGHRWGRWRFNRECLAIEHTKMDYDIDLEELNTPADVLYLVRRYSGLVTEADVGYLIRALDDVLHIGRSTSAEPLPFNATAYLLRRFLRNDELDHAEEATSRPRSPSEPSLAA